jgi:xylan 1,4-beta-xylosidase
MLHRLGTTRLATTGKEVLATRRRDGSLAIALWNLVPPTAPARSRTVTLRLRPGATARVTTLDDTHGNSLTAWKAMGSPPYPTRSQIAALNHAAIPAAGTWRAASDGTITVSLAPNALALVEVARAR